MNFSILLIRCLLRDKNKKIIHFATEIMAFLKCIGLVLVVIVIILVDTKLDCYQYNIKYFKQLVDHFSFTNSDTFEQKFLISDQYWNSGVGPIFFYAGNEGDIEWFCNNTGFMWEIAPEFRALIIFAEHRFYGESMPYGNQSYMSPGYLGYLTSEQALADFAELLTHLKAEIPGAQEVPIIAFGGSYGGMLAAWIRIKYPHIIQGSLASSAPILQFQDLTPCGVFNEIVTQDFTKESPECSNSIRKSWNIFNRFNSTEEGRKFLSETFRLCSSIKTDQDFENFKGWFTETYGSLAMMNYPYPTNFMAPLPGWPIKESCKFLMNSSVEDHILMKNLFLAVSIYFNYTGTEKCLNTSVTSTANLGNDGWYFQACSEMIQPMCADGVKDMFEPIPWNYEAYAENCFHRYGVRPRPLMGPIMYGGRDITASSNIVFSNGDLDPWSGGGVLSSLSPSLVAIYITDSAHHLDLRSANDEDPESVVHARHLEKKYIQQWIDEYYQSIKKKKNSSKLKSKPLAKVHPRINCNDITCNDYYKLF